MRKYLDELLLELLKLAKVAIDEEESVAVRGEDFGDLLAEVVRGAVDHGPLDLAAASIFVILATTASRRFLRLASDAGQVFDWRQQVRSLAEHSVEQVPQDGVHYRLGHVLVEQFDGECDAEDQDQECEQRTDRASVDLDLRRQAEPRDVVNEFDEARVADVPHEALRERLHDSGLRCC